VSPGKIVFRGARNSPGIEEATMKNPSHTDANGTRHLVYADKNHNRYYLVRVNHPKGHFMDRNLVSYNIRKVFI
jgi:hypothetical protein